ncbi:hypothetical protein HYD58_03865 [Mycoplasmopsis bovis]|nr:hypothetical protein [Mycoplasmopsis bovis]QQH65965.1 hypothetical protein HYD58_03865 [Mycoplasmopsis bovis]
MWWNQRRRKKEKPEGDQKPGGHKTLVRYKKTSENTEPDKNQKRIKPGLDKDKTQTREKSEKDKVPENTKHLRIKTPENQNTWGTPKGLITNAVRQKDIRTKCWYLKNTKF